MDMLVQIVAMFIYLSIRIMDMRKKTAKESKGRRNYRLACTLNDMEREIIYNYIEKNKIKSKSAWVRETLLWFVYTKIESNAPTLFSEHEMRR